MGWLLAAVAVAVVIGMLAPRSVRAAPPPTADDHAETCGAQGDQVELLRRYGTADDAARLIADGRGDDLAGLGYRADN